MAAVAISVQPADSEADPSDVEEDQELHEDDDASSGVAQNRSIIMHMLSQARVGMDLTRITLPTFILEKRSLLEMYAEFFAHPDLFASIPDNSDPRERIIAIARYYCSAFHAARKGAVAKKPYNPILGETFRCYWDLPGGRRNAPDDDSKRLIQSGPVPYASYSSVAFVAEQVSHHPPVSGFYAECIPKRMYVNGSIYTKSKFLGLSLGVHHIGSVRLCLMDYGEEYRVNLPNAYARSILTVPWLELGGKCHIECLQNGYTADVEFHCKVCLAAGREEGGGGEAKSLDLMYELSFIATAVLWGKKASHYLQRQSHVREETSSQSGGRMERCHAHKTPKRSKSSITPPSSSAHTSEVIPLTI
ncbi:Oxysterol-binding protein-related protein 9 [Geodia barretti]|uniref:Oxysterol-binding protein n=1 Tax=Geodia barretti TaxID=519541 RepID=A0AA35WAL9_GEOBA|nr:Oxysterol-binding protein-related protein 9 [Geodia barretti]